MLGLLESVENELNAVKSRLNELEQSHETGYAQLRDQIEAIKQEVAPHKSLQQEVDVCTTASR